MRNALAMDPRDHSKPRTARGLWLLLVTCGVLSCGFMPSSFGAEQKFDFGSWTNGQPPPNFRSIISGKGKPGEWKVVMDELPPLLPPLSPGVASHSKQAVLAQLSQDPTDERFPILIYQDEMYADFRLTTRFKTVSGKVEQMAGVVFRLQNETNFYVLRASSIGNNFRFYKVVNGQRGTIIGPETPIPKDTWHELAVECKGNQISCLLDGKPVIPTLTDSTFSSGKIGFWTKSDSVSYFSDTKITYTPREPGAQALVRDITTTYSRLLGLKVFVLDKDKTSTRLIA